MVKGKDTTLEFKGEDSILTELLSSELEIFKQVLENELRKNIVVKTETNNKVRSLKKIKEG